MSNRDAIKEIIDKLPDYKIDRILIFLRGVELDDDIEDDIFCENLVQRYLNDDSSDKHETISLEDFARQEGIEL